MNSLLRLGDNLPATWRAAMAWPAPFDAPRDNAGARCLFRRTFEIADVPATFPIWVSADSRYRFYVNGQLVGHGPLKGTLERYHVECYDIAPLLKTGTNLLCADVVWFGYNMPLSEEHSGFAGLLVQGPEGAGVDTPGDITQGVWKCYADTGFGFDRTAYTSNAHLFLAGMEVLDGDRFPWGWLAEGFDDSAWLAATVAVPLSARGGDPDADLIWNFKPRDQPALAEETRPFMRTLRTGPSGLVETANPFASGDGWTLPAGQSGELLLDAGTLTTAYLELLMEGGAGRTVEIVYSECVWHRNPEKPDDGSPYRWGGGGRLIKGKRDELEGGLLHGYQDTLTLPSTGDSPIAFEPFHWRTFWFVAVRVGAGDTPFTLRSAQYRFVTALPGRPKATFEVNRYSQPWQVWENSWRTLQLCSHETYEDCPGYEQLNYLLDTRNESLTTLYMTGDGTLPKRNLRLFRDTLRADGMVRSRTPSQLPQTIPIFALWWVVMLHDFWEWFGEQEQEFVRESLHCADAILAYFRLRLQPDGFVGPLPYWNPIGGEDAPGTDLDAAIKAGGSTYVTALYLHALNLACKMHREAGFAEDAERWSVTGVRLQQAITSAWNEGRGVWVERLSHPEAPVSQHTQAMAILANVATPTQTQTACDSIASGVPVAKMTRQQGLPFAEAMYKAHRYELAHDQMGREYGRQLDLGLTTWLEGGEEGRSDCHAWSAWPPVEYLRSRFGIRPIKPGWSDITVNPQAFTLDSGETIHASVPTPHGEVRVTLTGNGSSSPDVAVQAPEGVTVQRQQPL